MGCFFMINKIKGMIYIVLIILLLPYVATTLINGNFSTFNDLQNQSDEEAILIGMLAKEVSIDTSIEALKAQAVIARTNYYYFKENNLEERIEYMDLNEMEQIWGEGRFLDCYEYLGKVIKDTDNEVITYNNKIIIAPFHPISGGRTRNGNEIYNSTEFSYLVDKESKEELMAEGYIKIDYFDKEYFKNIIKLEVEDSKILDNISIVKRDCAGYVLEIKIGEKTVTGEEFKKLFGLNSECFYIDEYNGQIRIMTKGVGDGLGLSLYGANQMALSGKGYKEIIEYYYSGINIVKHKNE